VTLDGVVHPNNFLQKYLIIINSIRLRAPSPSEVSVDGRSKGVNVRNISSYLPVFQLKRMWVSDFLEECYKTSSPPRTRDHE
jgi:hypothetical protein